MFFMDHLNNLHSWGWEMVQFTCTALRTQGTESFKEDWVLSFQVGGGQPKLRVFREAGSFAKRGCLELGWFIPLYLCITF